MRACARALAQGAKAVSKESRAAEIAAWIRNRIEEGQLAPGDRLEERELSERFQVSKTPVREALIHLSSRGLVDLRQRVGATVRVLTSAQIVAMFEFMTELECMAARLAAARMQPVFEAQLRTELENCEKFLEDDVSYARANLALHRVIYAAASNEYLEDSVIDMRSQLRLYHRYPFNKAGRIVQSYQDHIRIVECILRGDGEAASEAMREHLTTGGKIFAELVAQVRQSEKRYAL